MARFENPEISFEVPNEWVDESRVRFVFPEAQANITLTKRIADPAVPLEQYATALLRQLGARHPGMQIVTMGPVRVGPGLGVHMTVEWKGENGRERGIHRLVFRDKTLWSFSASTPVDRLAETVAAIDRAVSSFVLQPPEG